MIEISLKFTDFKTVVKSPMGQWVKSTLPINEEKPPLDTVLSLKMRLNAVDDQHWTSWNLKSSRLSGACIRHNWMNPS